MHRSLSFIPLALTGAAAFAQSPPIDIEWSSFKGASSYDPYEGTFVTRDATTNATYWTAEADVGACVPDDDGVFQFTPAGLDTLGWTIDCFNDGSLDHARRLVVQDNDRWLLLQRSNIVTADVDLAVVAPEGSIQYYAPDSSDVPSDMVVHDNEEAYICSTFDNGQGCRATAIDRQGNVTWMRAFPVTTVSSAMARMALLGDTVVLALLPKLYYLDRVSGNLIDSVELWVGPPVWSSPITVLDGDVYFAGGENGSLNYGRFHPASAAMIWSGTLASGPAMAIGCDLQGRIWIASKNDAPIVFRIATDGTPDGPYALPFATVDDMSCVNGHLAFCGRVGSAAGSLWILSGTPQP